jgi:hypothetical protein
MAATILASRRFGCSNRAICSEDEPFAQWVRFERRDQIIRGIGGGSHRETPDGLAGTAGAEPPLDVEGLSWQGWAGNVEHPNLPPPPAGH